MMRMRKTLLTTIALPLAFSVAGGCGDIDLVAADAYGQNVEELCHGEAACVGRSELEEAACVDEWQTRIDDYTTEHYCAEEWTNVTSCWLESFRCYQHEDGFDYYKTSDLECRAEETKTATCMIDNGSPDNAAACRDTLRQAVQQLQNTGCQGSEYVYGSGPECEDYELSFCDLIDFWECVKGSYSCDEGTVRSSSWRECSELKHC